MRLYGLQKEVPETGIQGWGNCETTPSAEIKNCPAVWFKKKNTLEEISLLFFSVAFDPGKRTRLLTMALIVDLLVFIKAFKVALPWRLR